MARSSDGNATCYAFEAFLVLWMTPWFHKMWRMAQNQRRPVCFVEFARWRQRGPSCCLRLQACFPSVRRYDFRFILFYNIYKVYSPRRQNTITQRTRYIWIAALGIIRRIASKRLTMGHCTRSTLTLRLFHSESALLGIARLRLLVTGSKETTVF